jgi:hypothetical protein
MRIAAVRSINVPNPNSWHVISHRLHRWSGPHFSLQSLSEPAEESLTEELSSVHSDPPNGGIEAGSLSHRKRKPLPLFAFIGVHSRFRCIFMVNNAGFSGASILAHSIDELVAYNVARTDPARKTSDPEVSKAGTMPKRGREYLYLISNSCGKGRWTF